MQYQNRPDGCQPRMLSQLYEPLWGLVVPELCPRCESPTDAGFCTRCRAELVSNEGACPICGISAGPPGAERCRAHSVTWQTDAVLAPWLYRPPLEHYIHGLKFAGQRCHGRACGLLLAEAAYVRRTHVDALVPVPLHARRLLERGYNQALEIARPISHVLKRPILRTGIVRVRPTPPQTQLGADERAENLRAAFDIRRDIRGFRLAIIDDVITTGATVNALALALRAAGAAHVEAWAVARTAR
jgi:ComF family protein